MILLIIKILSILLALVYGIIFVVILYFGIKDIKELTKRLK